MCHEHSDALSATTEQFLPLPVDHTDHGVESAHMITGRMSRKHRVPPIVWTILFVLILGVASASSYRKTADLNWGTTLDAFDRFNRSCLDLVEALASRRQHELQRELARPYTKLDS